MRADSVLSAGRGVNAPRFHGDGRLRLF